MRRLAFVLSVSACGLLLVQPPASAKCVELPFDTAVRQSQVVWWGTVTGARHEPGTANFSGGWTLTVRLREVLKGPGSVGETHPAVPALCSMTVFSERDAQQYVGRTQLFLGRLQGDVLVPFVQVLTPQDLSPGEQFQRALKDLGLLQSSSPPYTGIPLATGSLWWVIVPVLVLVMLVAAGSFIMRRRHQRAWLAP